MSPQNPKSGHAPDKVGKVPASSAADPSISIRNKPTNEKLLRRSFPGPRGASALLRVAIDRSAHAELVVHAKSSLEAEVCGVLVGQMCEDEEGPFVHVEAVIRGNAASHGSTHVTFTQATWNGIHETLERDYPRLRMVGWYHTHPGFGVEFSEMDLFIQRNFFSGPAQIALVTDPVNGATAICINGSKSIEYLSSFWVEGREQKAQVPGQGGAGGPTAGMAPASADLSHSVKALEDKVNQLVQVIDEQRASYSRFLTFAGMAVCLGIVISVGYLVYSSYISRNQPPKLNQFVPIPIQVGDKTVLLGVGIAEWQVPPELNASFLQAEIARREAEAKARAREAGNTNSTATNSASSNAASATATPTKSP